MSTYLSLTDADRDAMLEAIGVASIDELFRDIPAGVRYGRELDVAPALSEAELSSHRWSELLDVMSEVVGYPWLTVPRDAETAPRTRPVRRAVKALYATHAGPYVRAAWGALPPWERLDRMFAGMRDPRPPVLRVEGDGGAQDAALFDVLSCAQEFRSRLIDVGLELAQVQVAVVRAAGTVVRQRWIGQHFQPNRRDAFQFTVPDGQIPILLRPLA